VLRYRLILGPVLIALLVLFAWLDTRLASTPLPGVLVHLFIDRVTFPPGFVLFFACLAISVLASRELAAILRDKGIHAAKRITTFAAIMGLLVSCAVPSTASPVVAVALVATASVIVLMMALLFYSRHKSVQGVVAAAGGTLLAFVYLGLMFGFLLAIRREHSAWLLLWVLVTTKSSDIGAYFTGRTIGRHKLIVWLSPGKTWEGLVGGCVLAAGVGAGGIALLPSLVHPSGLAANTDTFPAPWTGALAGLLFGLVGQMGDLTASLFKRDAGIKDSGRALPGFGGILDVLDSILLVAPLAYWWIVLVHPPGTAG
jgi:phosphatidate cytidylyltransferase